MKTLPIDAYTHPTPQRILDKHRDTWEAKKQASAERFKIAVAEEEAENARFRCSTTGTNTICAQNTSMQEEVVDRFIDKNPKCELRAAKTESFLRTFFGPIFGIMIAVAATYASFFLFLGFCLLISGNWDPSAPQEGIFGGTANVLWSIWNQVGPWWGGALWFTVVVITFTLIANPEILLALLLFMMWSDRK